MAFADIYDDMDLAEAYLKAVFGAVLKECPEDLELFEKFVRPGILARLKSVVEEPFARITYTEAISILEKALKSLNSRSVGNRSSIRA